MSIESVQNEFGYFGKIPTLGDFVQQVLPQDFANSFHEWLQISMAGARESLDDQFLTFYLNCPVWKFVIAPGVCGAQAVAGLTIPSVDKVGRYFNFTLATVLQPETNAIAYVVNNSVGFLELENLALDILEMDFSKDEIELKLREISLQFSGSSSSKAQIESAEDHLKLTIDKPLLFADEVGALLNHYLANELNDYSMWWYGHEGQTRSNMIVCDGMPSPDVYLHLLTLENPPEPEEQEMDYVDQIIAGDV